MPEWRTIRLTRAQYTEVDEHGAQKWATRSPSEALRRILTEYFSALGQQLPDQEVRWGGPRGGGRPKKHP